MIKKLLLSFIFLGTLMSGVVYKKRELIRRILALSAMNFANLYEKRKKTLPQGIPLSFYKGFLTYKLKGKEILCEPYLLPSIDKYNFWTIKRSLRTKNFSPKFAKDFYSTPSFSYSHKKAIFFLEEHKIGLEILSFYSSKEECLNLSPKVTRALKKCPLDSKCWRKSIRETVKSYSAKKKRAKKPSNRGRSQISKDTKVATKQLPPPKSKKNPPRLKPTPVPPHTPTPITTPTPKPTPVTPADLTKLIKQKGNNYTISKTFPPDAINEVLTSARAIPITTSQGNMEFKIEYIKKGSLFSLLGVKPGDIIYEINGQKIKDLTIVLNLYTQLFKTYEKTKAIMTVRRKGKPINLTYEIIP